MAKNKKEVQPNWRPDFRIHSTLPDIKVIRTDFIINFIAVTLVLVAGFYVLQREYRTLSLRDTIDELERQVRVAEADDNRYLDLSSRFREKAKHVREVELFYTAPFLVHELVAELAMMRLEDLIFSRISLTEVVREDGDEQTVEYQINLVGDARSLPVVGRFKVALEESGLMRVGGLVSSVSENVQPRNRETGIFPYRISVTMEPVEDGGKEGGE